MFHANLPLEKTIMNTWDLWSDEDTATVKRLWTEGKSGGLIARIMHRTRGAVIGKVHRLGLPKRPSFNAPAKPKGVRPLVPYAGNRPRTRLPSPKRPTATRTEIDAAPMTTLDTDLTIPFEQRRSLLQLDDSMCRFPVGDPHSAEFFFCGAEALAEQPYCAVHCKRCFMAKVSPSTVRPFRDLPL